ncbi:hypothetical protein LWI28_013034 [Acer negundo]|uniref:RING-type domain-containing protein n=1 Tax=Acer negundo TaxID=4023 RepID=A0AAD5P361_ACENE|nr:hypothetical protein LWI28_013034 [Acer negundo]
MASSQVEIASSSPFGGVLKEQNSRRERCRESNNARAAAFQKNLKELVRDHLHNRISISADENSQNQSKNVDSWAANEQKSQHNQRNLRFLTNNQSKNNENQDGNSTQSRILDRWAAKQARDMVSTIEKQSQEAELFGAASSTSQKNPPPPPDELENSRSPPPETSNLGASSLVQIWEARMNRSNSLNSNNLNLVSISSRTSSGLSNVENVVSTSSPSRAGTSRGSEMGDSVDERSDTAAQANPENSFPDWETQSDRNAMSEPITARNSDARESERVRIADIIKRLTSGSSDDNDNETGSNVSESPSRERRHAPFSELVEQREQQQQPRGLTQVISSPKIRGRQAFADLLMQLERDRHKELHSLVERQAVSKFAQRGRIQSLLRLRFLQRGMAFREQERECLQSAGSPLNRLSLGSSIMQLREKFGTGIENGVTTQSSTSASVATSSRNSRTEMANMMENQDDSSSTSNRLSEDDRIQEEVSVSGKSNEDGDGGEGSPRTDDRTEMANTRENQDDSSSTSNRLSEDDRIQEEVLVVGKLNEDGDGGEGSLRTDDDAQQGTNSGSSLLESQETAETTAAAAPLNVCDGNEMGEVQDADNHQQENSETRAILNDPNENEMAYEEEQEAGDQDQEQPQLFLHPQETTETEAFVNSWYANELSEAEEPYEDDQFFENNNDWITEISRPRSHWENLRQARYQERLSSSTDTDEIHQLIVRKRVSTFLSSDFRDTMDQLMTSRAMTQADIDGYHEEEDETTQERMSQLLLSHLQRHLHPATTNQEEEEQTQEIDQVEEEYRDQEEEEDDHYQEEEEDEEEEEEDEEEEEEEEEERSSMSHQFHEAGEYCQSSSTIQMPSPSAITTWSFRDIEVGDDSDHPVASSPPPPPPPKPLPSQTYYQDSSSRSPEPANRLSIEMELIYDLRGQMEQLNIEMAELRKSLQSTKMQHSNPQEEVRSVSVMANNSLVGAPKRRTCCICYEMQVDSLLYRCGHMCTCLKCAHELQWSTGKCPICRAPIDDVVRAYMDA